MEKYFKKLKGFLELIFFEKAPKLPLNIREWVVELAPYFEILTVLASIPIILTLFGLHSLSALFSPPSLQNTNGLLPVIWSDVLFALPIFALQLGSIKGLFDRDKESWEFIYWAQGLSVISALLQFNFMDAFFIAVISFYVLFQIRSLYR